jgi:DNA-binding CsgD family transcriptional regulator
MISSKKQEKQFATVALMLNLGVAGIYAQQRPVTMTFSGTAGPSTINLQYPGTNAGEDDFAGNGTLGPFTFRDISAETTTSQPSLTRMLCWARFALARGFVLKRASAADLIDALRTVALGGSYLSSQISARLLDRIQSGTLQLRTRRGPLEKLSPGEQQVLRLIADGKTSKDIAVLLELGEQTVRSYRARLSWKSWGLTTPPVLPRWLCRPALGSGDPTQAQWGEFRVRLRVAHWHGPEDRSGDHRREHLR